MTNKAPHALIAGGGIGGLTAALCLAQRGWQVDLFEASPQLGEVGAGLQLSPNAMHVLEALGLGEAIAARAFEPEALELRLGRSGRRVFSIPAAASARQRWGAPYLHIHRADLIDTLAAALAPHPSVNLHLDTGVRAYDANSPRPRLQLSDDSWQTGDLIIGADGLHSVIRTQMHGAGAARFTGNLAWRATVPMDRLDHPPPPTASVWAGRGRHAVTYRLRGGTLANFVGVVERSDWTGETWGEQGETADVLSDFSGWHPTITELIEKADAHYRWALFDRPPVPHWQHGAVTLLGDACHPMLPFMAQGAAQAIEDAYVLARNVSAAPDIPAALARFQAERLPRTTRLQAASRANMKTFHRRNPLIQFATYGPMWLAGHLLPGFVRSRQDWIYGHDVTATDR